MTDKIISYACLSWLCVGWPAVCIFVYVNLTRYGLVGWIRRSLERAKANLPPERGVFADDR